MNQPKGMALHFDPSEFIGDPDTDLLESMNLELIDLVNVVLLVWPVFQDCAGRVYEVVVEEVAEMVTSDPNGHPMAVLAEHADNVVELCTRIYSYLQPAIQDLPDQLYHAVQAGLRDDLEHGVMHVVHELPGTKTLLLSLD